MTARSPRRAKQRCLALADAQHQGCGQERRELGQGHRGERTAFRGDRLGAETGRLRAERGCRIGEIADHRCGQFGRDGNRQGARQFVARGEPERHGATARQNHARRRPGNLAQPPQIFFGHQLGGNRKDADLVVADQHRLAATQRGDRLAEGAAVQASWTRALSSPLPPCIICAPRLAPATLFDLTYAAE